MGSDIPLPLAAHRRRHSQESRWKNVGPVTIYGTDSVPGPRIFSLANISGAVPPILPIARLELVSIPSALRGIEAY